MFAKIRPHIKTSLFLVLTRLLQCPNVRSGAPQPFFHLLDGNYFWIIDDPIDFSESLPALLYRDNARPPLQGRRTHVISTDREYGHLRLRGFRSGVCNGVRPHENDSGK